MLSSSVSENLAFSLAHLQDLIATDRQATKVGWCANVTNSRPDAYVPFLVKLTLIILTM